MSARVILSPCKQALRLNSAVADGRALIQGGSYGLARKKVSLQTFSNLCAFVLFPTV